MQVLDSNPTNWLVLTENGSTETKSKSSSFNQLLYGQDLWGLLKEGSEIWQTTIDDETVRIVPDEDAKCYTLQVNGDQITLPANRKTDLVDALDSFYNDEDTESLKPLVRLFDEVRENMMRPEALSPFLEAFPDKVAERDDGWFINGHLLLTYEGDFYHPENETRNRGGAVIGEGLSIQAYGIRDVEPDTDMNRNVGDYRLSDRELQFVARVIWAVENTPDET